MFPRNSGKDADNSLMTRFPPLPQAQPQRLMAVDARSDSGAVENKTLSSQLSGPLSERVSVIGSDLTILGQDLKIVSKGSLQIDGHIQGEIRGTEVMIGAHGQVDGTVAAQNVTVEGRVNGSIVAVKVNLRASSVVDGEIFHNSLSIEEGAMFEGSSKRKTNTAELLPNLDIQLPSAQGKGY
jgi:cytoskeletal protein CcmA (bactofilin family)